MTRDQSPRENAPSEGNAAWAIAIPQTISRAGHEVLCVVDRAARFWKDHAHGRTARATWEKSRTGQHFARAIRGAGEFGDCATGKRHHRGSDRATFFARSASVAASKQPHRGRSNQSEASAQASS